MSRSLPSHVGPYSVLRQLGRGSNGVVYLARRGEGEPCALKLLLHADSEGQARFDLEAAISGRLAHPLIVGALETGVHEGRYKWIAMEYVDGETLQDRLVRGPLSAGKARRLFGDLADALTFAHERGVIHRDLKPANVLIDKEGRAHLTDFGLARTLDSNLTRAGDMIGTPYYMAPEQLSDPRGVDVRADVYALGVMLYEALAGERPFEGKTIPEVTQAKRRGVYKPLARLAPDLPPDLVATCERAMALHPSDRYESVQAFARALVEPKPDAASAPNPTLIVLAILAVTSLFLVGVVARWRSQTGPSAEPAELSSADPDQVPDPEAAARAARLEVLSAASPQDPPEVLQVLAQELRQLAPPAPASAHDALATACLEGARARARQREPFQVPLTLLQLAEATAASEALIDGARLERASYLFRRGRFEEAREVARSVPPRADRIGLQARYVAAFGLIWLEQTEEGLEELRRLWRDDEAGPVGLNAGAVFHSYTGRNDIGEQLALQSLALDDSYADPWISLTFCRNDLSSLVGQAEGVQAAHAKLAEALEANERAMALQPDHPRAWMARAFAVGNLGRAADAVAAYDQVIELTEPTPFARALRYRGRHHAQDGKLREAFTDFDRAHQRNPRDVEALLWRGVVSDALGDPSAADRDWREAERLDRRVFEFHVSRMPPQVIERVRALLERR